MTVLNWNLFNWNNFDECYQDNTESRSFSLDLSPDGSITATLVSGYETHVEKYDDVGTAIEYITENWYSMEEKPEPGDCDYRAEALRVLNELL